MSRFIASDSFILRVMAVSACVFVVMGSMFAAPFWLFDGISFAGSCALGCVAARRARLLRAGGGGPGGRDQPQATGRPAAPLHPRSYALAAAAVAGFSIPIDIAFATSAILLWDEVM